MYLKSLEIQGFKSFPDKTVISFDDGLTAIVGPNGSGKSNISDAIRWVLGEQSTKTLRGQKMEDVIFGGTRMRRPVGFAEVSLTVDNSSRFLNIEYNEVTATRRYYRSGESEFYINRKTVRLRDLHELFMDTGLGRDGYSIIGQGRIDEVLSQKSEDRREIFEEAAGITKYRYRKEEAERKLAGCEENLVRIRDIIAELESRVGPLKEQSEKAREYLALFERQRSLEVSVWLESLSRLKDNLKKSAGDYQIAEETLESERENLKKLYDEAEALSAQMRGKDTEADRIRDELRRAETILAGLSSDVSVLKANYKNNENNIFRIKSELGEQESREGGLLSQIETHRNRIEELLSMEEGTRLKLQEVYKSAGELSHGAADIETQIDALKVEQTKAYDEISLLKAEYSALLSKREQIIESAKAAEEEIDERERSLSKEKEQAEELAGAVGENAEKVLSLANMIEGFEILAETRRKKAADKHEQKQKCEMRLNALNSRHKLLCDMEREYEGFSRAVKMVMQESARGSLKNILGTVSSLVEVGDEIAVAVETALGGALSNIVCESEEDAKAAIGFLKSTDAGRATFLPVTAVSGQEISEPGLSSEPGFCGIASALCRFDARYSGIFRQLIGRTVIAENIDAAIRIAKKYRYRFKIVTKDGQVLSAGGAMTGGSLMKNTGVLSRSNEISRLKSEIKDAEEKLQKALRESSEAEREAAAAKYDIETMAGQRRIAEDETIRLKTAAERHGSLIASLEDILANMKSGISESSAKAEALEKTAEETRLRTEERQKHADACLHKAGLLAGGRSELLEKYGAVSKQEAALKTAAAEQKAEREATEQTLSQMAALFKDIQGDRNQREELIKKYEAENLGIAAELEAKNNGIAEYNDICSQKRELIHRLTEEKMAVEGLRVRKDKQCQTKNDELLNLERERARLESRKTQAEMEEHQILDRLWESYELTHEGAQSVAAEIESVSKANRSITQIKSQIKALGSINTGAIEEYAAVSERYEFLSAQKNDLESAQKELLNIISEVTRNMHDIFEKSFGEINRSFSETFVEIFGGGEARLELTDPSDILNCGIEIKVSLPGKSLRTITLLSGGEKAFVAIALFFAILKVRPTPFCVLDEIDAALDDVNVASFVRYLRGLLSTTQFIVITHRRGTMQEADTLYGITMQEQGVSKTLTLSITQVERELNMKLG